MRALSSELLLYSPGRSPCCVPAFYLPAADVSSQKQQGGCWLQQCIKAVVCNLNSETVQTFFFFNKDILIAKSITISSCGCEQFSGPNKLSWVGGLCFYMSVLFVLFLSLPSKEIQICLKSPRLLIILFLPIRTHSYASFLLVYLMLRFLWTTRSYLQRITETIPLGPSI